MSFNYQWTNRDTGKYAIRKIGKQAGREIERKDRQTTATHHFLTTKEEVSKINTTNEILKTITFDFIYEGNNEKSIRQYLSKEDIDGILQDIDNMKGKEIIIPLKPASIERKIKRQINNGFIKKIKPKVKMVYGEETYNRLISMAMDKQREEEALKKMIKTKKQEIKEKEENIINTITIKEGVDFTPMIDAIYSIAKWEKEREGGVRRQKKYRGKNKPLDKYELEKEMVKSKVERDKLSKKIKELEEKLEQAKKDRTQKRKRGRPRKK